MTTPYGRACFGCGAFTGAAPELPPGARVWCAACQLAGAPELADTVDAMSDTPTEPTELEPEPDSTPGRASVRYDSDHGC